MQFRCEDYEHPSSREVASVPPPFDKAQPKEVANETSNETVGTTAAALANNRMMALATNCPSLLESAGFIQSDSIVFTWRWTSRRSPFDHLIPREFP